MSKSDFKTVSLLHISAPTRTQIAEASKRAKAAHPLLPWKECKRYALAWIRGMSGFPMWDADPGANVMPAKRPISPGARTRKVQAPKGRIREPMYAFARTIARVRKQAAIRAGRVK